jgi:HAD superfamily hydrolase (TIGR01509 family)
MLALVEQLAERRRVMIFSNTDAVHWAFNGRASDGRLHALDAHLSFELGLLKPSVEAFGKVAERAGIEPARSLFFDDVPANVEAARKAGFQAEVFVDEATLRRFLRARGILD